MLAGAGGEMLCENLLTFSLAPFAYGLRVQSKHLGLPRDQGDCEWFRSTRNLHDYRVPNKLCNTHGPQGPQIFSPFFDLFVRLGLVFLCACTDALWTIRLYSAATFSR